MIVKRKKKLCEQGKEEFFVVFCSVYLVGWMLDSL